MISEFVWIEQLNQSGDSLHFACSLPDPDLYGDDKMIVCGDIVCKLGIDGNVSNVNIVLFENIRELCVGETYQRRSFVQAVAVLLLSKYKVDIRDLPLEFSDCWGSFCGDLDSLDNDIREMENE